MNRTETYRFRIQHCRDMARVANGPVEKKCWLLVADGWARLLQIMEISDQQVQFAQTQAESSQTPDMHSSPPGSISFYQFSLVDRQEQSSAQAASFSFASLFLRR
jgi:hypothetical protein